MNIPKSITDKYNISTYEEYVHDEESKMEWCKLFLRVTDYIPNKILEGAATSEEYAEELYYREFARQQMNGGTEELVSKPLDTRIGSIERPTSIMLGTETKMEQASEQIRKALQMYAQTLTDEQAMEVATVYPAYEVGKSYKADEFIAYGVNEVGDPQLYKVVQAHTSQSDWKPDATPSLYAPIGLNPQGYPKWSKPTGAHDAYNTGDIVDYNGTLYKSLIDGNTYSPEEYPAGWEQFK